MRHPAKKIHDDDLLKQALHFDDDDLAANQAGEFSLRQSARLRWNRAIQLALAITLFGAGVPIAGLILYVILQTGGPKRDQLYVFGFILLLWLTAVWSCLTYARGIAHALRTGVHTVEGYAELGVASRGKGGTAYLLRVEGAKFQIPGRAFFAFRNRDPYRIYYYYLPRGAHVLSAEWLRDDDPFVKAVD